jgi:hypothetical protein
LIFAAGYILGRPEGRAKVAELAKRPEVTQLREQAASTVSSGLKSGKEQLTNLDLSRVWQGVASG